MRCGNSRYCEAAQGPMTFQQEPCQVGMPYFLPHTCDGDGGDDDDGDDDDDIIIRRIVNHLIKLSFSSDCRNLTGTGLL